ncbi:MAG: anti-sigma F factor [Christensenellales bacterium]
MITNEMHLKIPALSQNESFARVVVGAFAAQLNPTLEQLADIKTAVSEAVTNAIIHGYEGRKGFVEISAILEDDVISIEVKDKGRGIENLAEAMQPFYTSKPDGERSGMGFTVMQTFMDSLHVSSQLDRGTVVKMEKRISSDWMVEKE